MPRISDPQRAPKWLTTETRAWWTEIARTFELEPHHLRLLTLAGEMWDRGQQARQQIEREGATVRNRFAELRPHPAVATERQAAIAYARVLRELDLDVEPPRDRPGRPPKGW